MPKTKIQTVLDNLVTRNERIFRVALQQWMGFAQKQIQQDLMSKFKKDVTSDLTDWSFVEDQGKRTLKPATLKIMQSGGNAAYKQLAIVGSFDILNVKAVGAADKFCAKLVKDVTANTKKGVRTYIREGVKAGKSMPKIAKELRPLVGLTGRQTESIIDYRRLLGEKFPQLSATQVDKKVMTYTNKTHRRRMENIARTETARAQNIGYCQGLEEVGVVEAELQIAPTDYCDECLALDKTRYPVAEAAGVVPVHPRCRCAMLPVVGDETITETLASAPPELPGAMASEEGLMPWKRYLGEHTGEKPTSGLLYDWYKLRYETTGKITGGTKKYLRAHAAKFEATSIKISKPIPGLEDIIKPIKVPVAPKPVDIPVWPKPTVPKFTAADEKVLHRYTTEEGFDAVSRAQRGLKLDPVYFEISTKEALALGDKIQIAAMKLAAKPGKTYRGLSFTTKEGQQKYLSQFKVGKTWESKTLQSTTEMKGYARQFLEETAAGHPRDPLNGVLLNIKHKTGRSLVRFSDNPSEKEILLLKGSKYKVVKIVNNEVFLEEIVTKIPVPVLKPPGLLPKSYFNEVDKWDERLAAHKASLRERLGFDIEALKMHRTDLPEYKEALAKFEKAMKSYTKPTADFNYARKHIDADTYGAFGSHEQKLLRKAKRNINKFYDDVGEIACNDAIKSYGETEVSAVVYRDRVVRQAYVRYRASADPSSFSISMSESNNVGVYFHELGHLMEAHDVTRRKAFRWVKARGQGKSMPYSRISAWSKDPQNAFKDKFIDPYVGKFYRDGETEVMSMGMQQFTSYKSMMRFAKKDFDHFAFIHGILTGAI